MRPGRADLTADKIGHDDHSKEGKTIPSLFFTVKLLLHILVLHLNMTRVCYNAKLHTTISLPKAKRKRKYTHLQQPDSNRQLLHRKTQTLYH